jgi:hypothetical protein
MVRSNKFYFKRFKILVEKSSTISCNEEYSYSVSKTDYITQSGTINTNKNETIEVTLIADEG